MGCANSGVSLDLAKHLMTANKELLCLVVSHENVSAGGYIGNDHSMLLPYALFRVSCSASLLTNRYSPPPIDPLIMLHRGFMARISLHACARM